MSDICPRIFSRNWGLVSEVEQDSLFQATVAIAGVGGVGGLLAERLIRLGVGHIKITDPGTFEESNLNRQFGSTMENVGQNKAKVVYSLIKDINLRARVDWDDHGIQDEADAQRLVSNCDLLIDEMDFGLFRESIMLQRAARQKGIHYFFTTAMGFGALVAIFGPEGLTLEEYNKMPRDVDVSDPARLDVPPQSIVPEVPSYAAAFSPETIQQLMAGKLPGPTSSVGVGLASIMAANEAMNIILKKRDIPIAPAYTYVDLIDRKFVVGSLA